MPAMLWNGSDQRFMRIAPQQPISRRSFLALAGRIALWASGVLSAIGVARFLSYQPQTNRKTIFELGPASQYPPGSITPLPEAKAILVHSAGGLQAFSTICPHLGCEVQRKAEGFECPCHGSRFGLDGSLINGPASQPLERLELETDEPGDLLLKLTP